jgi:hypothetical protein
MVAVILFMTVVVSATGAVNVFMLMLVAVIVSVLVSMPTAAAFFLGAVSVLVPMIMSAAGTMHVFVFVLVLMFVSMPTTAAILVLVSVAMLVSMIMMMFVLIMVVMVMVMSAVAIVISDAAGRFLGLHRGEIEKCHHDQPDAAPKDHGLEDAVRWQVVGDASAGVEVQHNAAPQQEEGYAEKVNAVALGGHGTKWVRVSERAMKLQMGPELELELKRGLGQEPVAPPPAQVWRFSCSVHPGKRYAPMACLARPP